MKRIISKFKRLTKTQKLRIIAAAVLTAALAAAIPVYAWFSRERKAAEMFKVEYPDALFINAAHREDRIYFELDGINVNKFITNDDGRIEYKYYGPDPETGEIKEISEETYEAHKNEPKYEKVAQKYTEYRYAFSVSGSNTTEFILQLAHTNNNLFRYKIYEAEETNEQPSAGTVYVEHTMHENGTTENTMVFTGDTVAAGDTLYYIKGAAVSGGEYKNTPSGAIPGMPSGSTVITAIQDVDDPYYSKTYSNNTKVEKLSVPAYWQADIPVTMEANKSFCKYFILEVTWNDEQQLAQTDKETDMVYLSVKRKG